MKLETQSERNKGIKSDAWTAGGCQISPDISHPADEGYPADGGYPLDFHLSGFPISFPFFPHFGLSPLYVFAQIFLAVKN